MTLSPYAKDKLRVILIPVAYLSVGAVWVCSGPGVGSLLLGLIAILAIIGWELTYDLLRHRTRLYEEAMDLRKMFDQILTDAESKKAQEPMPEPTHIVSVTMGNGDTFQIGDKRWVWTKRSMPE